MPSPVFVALAAAAVAAAWPAHAEQPVVSFRALSSTTVAPGGSVDFEAVFSKQQDALGFATAEPEPLPAPGLQSWLVSSTNDSMETLSRYTLTAQASNGALLGLDELTAAAGPGSLVVKPWQFSLVFNDPGSHSVSLSASWQSLLEMGDTSMTGSRTCTADVPPSCTPWEFVGVGGSALADTSGTLGPFTLSVQVVPEPQTTALWLLGLAALGGLARRRR